MKLIFKQYHSDETINLTIASVEEGIKNVHSSQLYKENAMIIFGYLASYFKEKLVQYLPRILTIFKKSLKNDRLSVQQSLSRSLIEIYEHSLVNFSEERSKLFENLISQLNIREINVQRGTSQSIYELCLYFLKTENQKEFMFFHDKFLPNFSTYLIITEDLLVQLNLMLKNSNIEDIANLIDQKKIIEHIFYCVFKRKKSEEALDTSIIIESCSTQIIIFDTARYYKKSKLLNLDKSFVQKLYDVIKKYNFHKIPKVRNQSKSILSSQMKVYKLDSIVLGDQNDIPLDIADEISVRSGLSLKSAKSSKSSKLQEQRDNLKSSKLKIKLEKLSPSPDNTRGAFIFDKPLNEMTKGKGWGPNVRGKNFLQSNTGYSGGFGGENIELGYKNREKKKLVKQKRLTRRLMQEEDKKNLRKSTNFKDSKFQLLDLKKEEERIKRQKRIKEGNLGGSDGEENVDPLEMDKNITKSKAVNFQIDDAFGPGDQGINIDVGKKSPSPEQKKLSNKKQKINKSPVIKSQENKSETHVTNVNSNLIDSADLENDSQEISEIVDDQDETVQVSEITYQEHSTYDLPDVAAKKIRIDQDIDYWLNNLNSNDDKNFAIYMIWQIALKLINESQFSKAFELILKSRDDIMLLRGQLMVDGEIQHFVHESISKEILRRICQVYLTNKIDQCQLTFIETGLRNNLLGNCDKETKSDLQDVLVDYSNHFNDHISKKSEYLIDLVVELDKF